MKWSSELAMLETLNIRFAQKLAFRNSHLEIPLCKMCKIKIRSTDTKWRRFPRSSSCTASSISVLHRAQKYHFLKKLQDFFPSLSMIGRAGKGRSRVKKNQVSRAC